jgi:hypothetical protein
MIKLYDNTSGKLLGEITEAQLQFLEDQLEEESLEDKDYSITPLELAYFEGKNADAQLLDLLRQALSGQDEVVIRWSRE